MTISNVERDTKGDMVMSTRKNVKQRAKCERSPRVATVKRKQKQKKEDGKEADDYDSRGYSTKLRDELCIQCMRYDMDRNPNDYVV